MPIAAMIESLPPASGPLVVPNDATGQVQRLQNEFLFQPLDSPTIHRMENRMHRMEIHADADQVQGGRLDVVSLDNLNFQNDTGNVSAGVRRDSIQFPSRPVPGTDVKIITNLDYPGMYEVTYTSSTPVFTAGQGTTAHYQNVLVTGNIVNVINTDNLYEPVTTATVTFLHGTGTMYHPEFANGLNTHSHATVEYDFRQQIGRHRRKNIGLTIIARKRYSIGSPKTAAEAKARLTLRDMISEEEFRRYITNGFIMVKGKSGFWYQLSGREGAGVTIFKNNKKAGYLCIHTSQECPPTDHVINMKVLVEFDEESIWRGANHTLESGVKALAEKERLPYIPGGGTHTHTIDIVPYNGPRRDLHSQEIPVVAA